MWGYTPPTSAVPCRDDAMWGYAPSTPDDAARLARVLAGRSRLATASLVVGIIGVVAASLASLVPWLGLRSTVLVAAVPLGVLAVVFGGVALARSARRRLMRSGQASAGLALGIVDLSLALGVGLILMLQLLH